MPIWKNLWRVMTGRSGAQPTMPLTNAPSGSKRDPKKSVIKRIGLAWARGSGSRVEFDGPEGFDLEEISRAYNTEAYVRQAIDKYVDFMFKAGWDIAGKNQNAVDYVRLRLAAIAEATNTPTKQLLIDIAEDLVLYHNVFIAKARMKGGSYTLPPGITATGLGGMEPVVGYFPLPVTTVQIARDVNGTVKKYKQEISGSEKPIELKPEDVIHIYVDKPKGRAFGVPFLWQVLDDIKLLRQVEELVARLIYKEIFPLYQYQVGLPKEGYEATDDEIEAIRDQISELVLDGGIVLPERHNITVVGAQGKALDAYEYLKYFEQRVFTGLGVSETMMGRGDTANRGTADNMTADMHDRIKAFQSIMEMFLNSFIVTELLREGGFDPLLRPEDVVEFKFKEIDLENKLKVENMAIQKWLNNAITHEELRMEIGMDPVSDEGRLFFNMVTAALEQQKAANAANTVDNNARPENQNGKKAGPGRKESLKESFKPGNVSPNVYTEELNRHWELTKEDVISLIKQYYLTRERDFDDFNPKEVEGILRLTQEAMTNLADKYLRQAFLSGVRDARSQSTSQLPTDINYLGWMESLRRENRKYLERLIKEDLTHLLSKAIRNSNEADAISKVVGAFSALNYRLSFIAKSETYYAYNYGFAKTAMSLGHKTAFVSQGDLGCESCSTYAGKEIPLSIEMKNIPPFHPNCSCILKLSNPQ